MNDYLLKERVYNLSYEQLQNISKIVDEQIKNSYTNELFILLILGILCLLFSLIIIEQKWRGKNGRY